MLYLLDTTVLIDYLRSAPAADRVDELSDRGDIACCTAINIEELIRGLRPRELERAEGLVRGMVVLPIGLEEGSRAGEWRREHARRGVTLSQADCLIAATALSAQATLATGNAKDFPMKEISVEHWPVGT